MSSTISVKKLQQAIELAAQRLSGDWVLMGGTLLPALGLEIRPTVDIDLVPLADAPQSELLKLMEISEELSMPVETINAAGAFYLRKIADHRSHLVLLREGKSARIFRPDLGLFLQLKAARLTENDCSDCLSFIQAFPPQDGTAIARLLAPFEKRHQDDPELLGRLQKIRKALHTGHPKREAPSAATRRSAKKK